MKYQLLSIIILITSCSENNFQGSSEIQIRNAVIKNNNGAIRVEFSIFNLSTQRIAIMPDGLLSKENVVNDTYKLDLNIDISNAKNLLLQKNEITYLPCIVLINPTSYYKVITEYEIYSKKYDLDTKKLKHLAISLYQVDADIPMYNSVESYLKSLQKFGKKIELNTDFEELPFEVNK